MLPPYAFFLHRYFNLIIFNCDNTTFVISVSGCPRPAYNFVSGVFKFFSQGINRIFASDGKRNKEQS